MRKLTSLLLGLAMAAPVLDAQAIERNWLRYPPVIATRSNGADIYAVGDAHSDYVRLSRVLKAAGLIDDKHNWTGGRSILVVTGDMIDKGPRALDVLNLLNELRGEAGSMGGRVIILAGNHEAEFLANPKAKKGAEFASQLRADKLDPEEVGRCEGPVGVFLCTLPFAAKVDDWFFSHAGNSGGRSFEKLAADIQAGVDKDGYRTKELIGEDSVLEARLDKDGPNGKPWLEERMPKEDEKALLETNAAALGVKHIVEGHKPAEVVFQDGVVRHAGEMFQRWGLFFLIDTGMSEGVNDSHGAVLHISKDTGTAICPDGTQTLLWSAAEKQDVGRAKPCR
ncbi:MAG TPA: metallophosphoesterase [Bryobacteraceae bacterium]|nr:metallophosphoesterase [Bryobacteraceae bacterium]